MRAVSNYFRLTVVAMAVTLSGCSITDLVKSEAPATVVGADAVQTQSSAVAAYKGVLSNFQAMYAGQGSGLSYVIMNGIFSDELQSINGAATTSFDRWRYMRWIRGTTGRSFRCLDRAALIWINGQ